MKGNTRGFTLVELLAVIVILAIIALITIPAILNVINDAREKGAEDKAWGTIDAARLAYTQAQGFGNEDLSGTNNKISLSFNDPTALPKVGNDEKNRLRISGERPYNGTVIINTSTGIITAKNLYFKANGEYVCSTDENSTKMCCKPGKPEGVGDVTCTNGS